MPFTLASEDALPSSLRELVSESGRLLGEVIGRERGAAFLAKVESLRSAMAGLRDQPPVAVSAELRSQLKKLRTLSRDEQRDMARAFTLFLELMNTCENAYRSGRLQAKERESAVKEGPNSLVYVLTAHPTEARSPENIEIFHRAQRVLERALDPVGARGSWREALMHELELAWRVFPTRERAPRVKDEADHIYKTALRPEILRALLQAGRDVVPVYLRTWVGGDKDGHPGVDERAMGESLQLSRISLLGFVNSLLKEVEETLALLPGYPLRKEIARAKKACRSLRRLQAGDGRKVMAARAALAKLCAAYEAEIHSLHPSLQELKGLLHMAPAFVVPLELRESSDVLMRKPERKPRAIERMLMRLAALTRGGDARYYSRGFIVSMTEKVEHLVAADAFVRKAFGESALPVIPLFETGEALESSQKIVKEVLAHPRLGKAVRKDWGNSFEIMVGYSDSSKQGGVFPSRLGIARAMHALEKECEAKGVQPVFFQGSGGSVDRGGGSVQDQVAWWPRAALRTYKVTIQGEMVERSLSTPEITRGQIENIAAAAALALCRKPEEPHSEELFRFAKEVTGAYRRMIHEPDFLRVVGGATPYSHLSALKIGSRPSRRTTEISVEGLRAIPWVLCWTQTRVLFPTWFGIGTAWKNSGDRKSLQVAFGNEPVFTSYVKALAFTLAKVELPLWRIYLDESGLEPELQEKFYGLFEAELSASWDLVRNLSGHDNPLWFKPWLGASIRLRSPIIHPLNLLQLLSIENNDLVLFRTTAAGISAGMMTTG
ncbi:MAG: phosphoenolpyruvate carboxylase [Bdellovibrionota bacterium]